MPTVTIPQAFELALQHHRAGRLSEAGAIYRQIVAHDPNHADSLHNLGVIASQTGRNEIAVEMIRRALAVVPHEPMFHCSLGIAFRKLGRLDEAVAAYRRAIELKLDFAGGHSNLGNALRDQGRLDESIAAYRRAIELDPDHAEAHNNLGAALRDQGRLDEAIAEYRRAVELKPDYAEAHNNLGSALKDRGRPDDAVAAYRRALHAKPDYAEAHNNLGAALGEQGRADEALAACRRALELKPDYTDAHNNLGNALKDRGQLNASVDAYRRAIRLQPNFAEAHNNLGNALKDLGLVDEAITACRRAVKIKPDYANARSNLLFFLHYVPDFDAADLFREHCRWDEIIARPLLKFTAPHDNERDPARRLRVGYISPDFREHSVAFFFESLLANHDPNHVEAFCYADFPGLDPFTARLQRCARHWRNTAGWPDAQVADLVRRDRLDILVDLAGHTAHDRLQVFARKPAPIQVTWLGYPDTTGLGAMDYRFTDAHVDPPGAAGEFHSERLVRLPQIFACFRPSDDAPPVAPPPALANGHVTFASFHTLAKLNDRLLGWWAKILAQVPDSRLLIAAAGLAEPSCRQRLGGFFAGKGIAPARLKFAGRQSLRQYLAAHREADVLLDSHPFSGHTIGCHAAWMGLPVVTLAGDRHCSRMVTSVLANLAMPEFIARSPEEYVKIAAGLAGDLPRLSELRSTLRERMRASPLMDAPRFAHDVEEAYREMWRTWCATCPAVS